MLLCIATLFPWHLLRTYIVSIAVYTHTYNYSLHMCVGGIFWYVPLQETLTGFKWMGNRSHDLISQGKDVLFAYEEAIGYMYGNTVLDKDGISAAAIMAEYAGWLYSQGKTFVQQLEDLYIRCVGEGCSYTINLHSFWQIWKVFECGLLLPLL